MIKNIFRSKTKVFLILILVLSFGLRFWKLDSYPAFNADEAAIGYNAYTLIQTGKDEHNNLWPIHFQSFNDYKPGGYFYLVLPFVATLGLNEWSVRIPNALLGVITIYLLFLLVKELFKDEDLKENLALLSSFMLAISPWHIHFSRGGWEVNTATFFMVLGALLFLKSLKNYKLLYWAVFSFAISLYTYHAARIVAPLLGLILVGVYWKNLNFNVNFKKYLFAVLLFFVLLLPLGLDFVKGDVASRAAGVGLFADTGPIARIEEQRTEHGRFESLQAKILHNKPVNYGLAFIDNWIDHYHGLFLFLSGDDIQRNKVPETGQLYIYEVITLIAGLIILVTKYAKNKSTKMLLSWLIIAPIAAALTFQSPHALRSQNMVIPLVIISSLGLLQIGRFFVSKKFMAGVYILIIVVLWSFIRYEHMYWAHMAKEYPFSSQYGVKELVRYIKEFPDKEKKIVVTDRYDQPYILFLFYMKYSPQEFQKYNKLTPRDAYGFSTVNHFGRYYFTAIRFEEAKLDNPNALIIGTPHEIPDEANIVKRIYGSNDYEYFDVVAN